MSKGRGGQGPSRVAAANADDDDVTDDDGDVTSCWDNARERGMGEKEEKGAGVADIPNCCCSCRWGGEGGYCSINRAKRMNQCKSDTVAAAAMHTC